MNTLRWCEYCGTTEVKTIYPNEPENEEENRLKPCQDCTLVYYCSEAHQDAHKEVHQTLCDSYRHYKETGEEPQVEEESKEPNSLQITINNPSTFSFEDNALIDTYGEEELVKSLRGMAKDVDVLVKLKQYRLASRKLKRMLEQWQAKELFPALAPEFEEEAKRIEAHEKATHEVQGSYIARHISTLSKNKKKKKKKKKKVQPKVDMKQKEKIAVIQQLRTKNTGTLCFAIAMLHWKLHEQSMVQKTMEYVQMMNGINVDMHKFKKHPWHKDQEEAMNFAMDGAKMNPERTPIDLCLALCKPLKKEKQTVGMIGMLEPMYTKLKNMKKIHDEALERGECLMTSGDDHNEMIVQGLSKDGVVDQKNIRNQIVNRLKECHRYLFEAYFQSGKLEKSQEQADALIELDNLSPIGYAQQGKIQVELAKTEKAETLYRKAIALDPSYAEAHLQLSQILANQPTKVKEAIKHCETCLENDKEDQDVLQPAYLLLSTIYISLNELNKAGVTLMRGLAQFPQSGIMLMHIGIFLVQNRKFKQGLHYLSKSLQSNSGLETWLSYIYILKHLTIAYIKEGLFRDAEESLCQILHKDQYNEFGCFFYDHLRAYLNSIHIHLPHMSQTHGKHQITTILHLLNEKKHEFYLSHILEQYLSIYPLTSGASHTLHHVKLNSKIEFYENMNVHEEWTEIFWTDYAIRLSTDAILTYNLMKKWHSLDDHTLEDGEPPANLEELENHISSKIKLGRTVMPIIEMGREYIDVAKKLKMSIVSGPHPPACVDSAFWCIPLLNLPMYCIVCGEVEGIHGNLTPCSGCESVYFCSDQCYDIDAKQHCHHCKRSSHKMTSHTIQNYRSFINKIQKDKKEFIETYTTDCYAINGRGAVVVDKTTFTQYPTDRITAVRYYTLREVSKFAAPSKLLKQALKHIESYNPKKQYVAIYNYGGIFQCDLMTYPSLISSPQSNSKKLMKALIRNDEQSKKKRKKKKKFVKQMIEEKEIVEEEEEDEEKESVVEEVQPDPVTEKENEKLIEQQILDGLLLDFAGKMDEKVVRLVFEQSKKKDYHALTKMLYSIMKPSKKRTKKKKKKEKKKVIEKEKEVVEVKMTWADKAVVVSKNEPNKQSKREEKRKERENKKNKAKFENHDEDLHATLSTSSEDYQDAVEDTSSFDTVNEKEQKVKQQAPEEEKESTPEKKPMTQFRPMYSWPMVPGPNGMMMMSGEYMKQQMLFAQQAYYFQQLQQTPVCIYYNTPGGCMRGDSCKFRHIRLPPPVFSPPPPVSQSKTVKE
mmetsp:Transcript_12235/g.18258  ORF Transcript_12235/g.18258 Transcript_12235/m.18258 type:complete len:1274 (-) Transcript_12235:31-3852(-)